MNRNEFLNTIVNATPYTSKDEELIEALKLIHEYFRDIKIEYDELVNVEPDDRLFTVNYNGDYTYVMITFKRRTLSFLRKSENIEVKHSNENFLSHDDISQIDSISFNENDELVSDKFSPAFSKELMEKYLDYLV